MKAIILFLSLFCFNALAEQNYTPISQTQPSASPKELKEFFSYKEGDIFIGNLKTAKVTVTGYTAFSCPHCGQFITEIMPKLKKEYFENKNKNVIYIYRTFPMSLADVKAKELLGCGKMDNSETVRFIDTLYSTAASWVHNAKFEQKLTEIARLFGISDKDIFFCMGSKKLEDKILQERLAMITKTKLAGVPLIAINGKIIEGHSYKNVSEAIDNELKLIK